MREMPTSASSQRDNKGRFQLNCKGGPGNPHNKKSGLLRAALYAAVTEEDIAEIVEALLDKAKEGDVQAAKELLDRVIGKPEAGGDITEKIEMLEELLMRVTNRGRN